MLEHEIKQILTKELYEEILCHEELAKFNKKSVLQINYYYDTKHFDLYQRDITLRIRQKNSNLNLELKYPVEEKTTYRVKREICEPIAALPMVIDLEHQFKVLEMTEKAHLIQPLITERTTIQATDHIRIDLDKSIYLGVVDYELEIEFHEGYYEEAYQLYKTILPAYDARSAEGKNSRFFKQYFEIMGKQ